MCGIVGLASSRAPRDIDLVRRMRDTLTHRGPDDEGLWQSTDRSVVLGHRRLAIIDLTRGGHQPMADRTGHRQLVFNGEIYNYRDLRGELTGLGHQFRSSSDSEVLVEAHREWGQGCLQRLNGMFAFAIYDEQRRTLFAARDRAGEKPFFYRHADGQLAFASELKALLADPACPRQVDPAALDSYLAYGYVPHDLCMVAGIRKLPPAHALMYDAARDELRIWPYWALPKPAALVADCEALVGRLEDLLLDSVRLRLIADVPVGILLSGGIDSSLVTAMACRVSTRVKTFTISFPGHGSYDESGQAGIVARHFDTEHVVMPAAPATLDILPELARQYDEPLADSSMVPTHLVSRLIRREATVALGGDGGDELFGGYPYYSWVQSQARVRRLIPAAARQALAPAVGLLAPTGLRGRNYLLGLTGDEGLGIVQFSQFFDPAMRRRLTPGLGDSNRATAERFKQSLAPSDGTALQRATAMDFRTYLPEDILAKVDRASMLSSLEVRAPWLDHRLVEFAFRDVPDRYRATATERKILPRLLAERLLPPALDLRRKQGFSLPLADWFKGDWGTFVEQTLTDPAQRLFDKATIRELLAGQRRGRTNMHRLFALTMFELWRREYRATLP